MNYGLNAEQQRAVEQIEGRLLILAGAGSGKTRVLTYRMAHLLQKHQVPPTAILGLTFTNKAATEMRHRLATLVDSTIAKHVTLSTFHSFCLQILRKEIHRLGYTSTFTLYGDHDVKRVINAIARDLLDSDGAMPSLEPSIEMLNSASNKGLKADEVKDPSSSWHEKFVQTLYQRLKDGMRAYNAVDFNGLLSLAVELFETFPEVLDRYQEQYRYIMVDEYQDTNPIQYRLTALLSAKHNNLCVVGDDDQSIYGWRGADVRNILNFDRAMTIKLEQNYRSTTTILQAANGVIGCNSERHEKKLWSACGEGSLIEVFVAPNESAETDAVLRRMLKLKEEKGVSWREMAILYRSNALSRQFEVALSKQLWRSGEQWIRGIPYRLHGSVEFYERREVKDLFAYLRVILNPLDQQALLRIINQPRRGIGENSLDKITSYNRRHQKPLWHVLKGVCSTDETFATIREDIGKKTLSQLTQFIELMELAAERFSKSSLCESLTWLIEKIDYKKAIREEVKSEQMREFKWENVQEFVNAATEFELQSKSKEKSATFLDFVQSLPLQNEWNGAPKDTLGDDKVNLLTFHSAKGLEFRACFLIGMEDQIIPHAKSMLQTGIEEERRLMYVAITRAMSYLTLSMVKTRLRMGKPESCRPSRFLYEIPKELLVNVDWRCC